MGIQPRAHGPRSQKGRYRHVDPRPGAYSHVHRANTPERTVRDTWIHVQGRTATRTWRTHPTEPVQPRALGQHSRKGPVQAHGSTSRGVQPRVQGQPTEKGRYRHVDPLPEAYSQVYRANTPKRTIRGTWTHVQRCTATCTRRTHRNWTLRARESTSRGVQPRALGKHTGKGRYGYVDPRPQA